MLKATLDRLCPCCRQALPATDDLLIDEESGFVRRGDELAYLTVQEVAMFVALREAFPRLRSRDQLLADLYWHRHEGEEPAVKIVDVWICKLRKKLEPLRVEIETHWGRGYRMVVPASGGGGEMTTINRKIGVAPELEWVAVALIDVARNYQREIKPHLVKRILEKFEWRKFGAVVLSRQADGRFLVVEGQHRCKAAMLHPDVHRVPAVIVPHADTAEEADSFLAINRDRMAVTSVEQYWAALTAGDPRTLAIAAVLEAAGCDVVASQGQYRPNLTNAISALHRSIQRYGDAATRRALLVIRAAWPKESRALRGTLITALARLIRNNKGVQDEALTDALRGQSVASLTAHAEQFRKLSGGSAEASLSKTIVELHNKGKRTNVILIGEAA